MVQKDADTKWLVVDAKGKVLGRLATEIAGLLRGKHRPDFSPHQDKGDFVIVVNAGQIVLTGDKLNSKEYFWHSGYPGGLKSRTAREMLAKHPERVIKRAVWGMLPKTKLGRRVFGKLKVYAGPEHPHQAQKPEPMGWGTENA